MGPHSPATHSIKAFVLEKVKAPPTSPAAYENGHPILSAADCLARESESAPASGDLASQRERERARAREREREREQRARESAREREREHLARPTPRAAALQFCRLARSLGNTLAPGSSCSLLHILSILE